LPVKLLVERFRSRPVKPDHLKCYDRTPVPLLQTRFFIGHANRTRFLPITLPLASVFSRAEPWAGEVKLDCGKDTNWLLLDPNELQRFTHQKRRHHEKNNCHARLSAGCATGIWAAELDR
jgi:hypothetical protein